MDAKIKVIIRNAMLDTINELTELQKQEDWFASESIEGLILALHALENDN